MLIATIVLCALVLIATAMPFIKSSKWWIRGFDFPRVQIAMITLAAIVLGYLYLDFNWEYKAPLLLLLAVALVYQVQFIIAYTPLYNTQAKDSKNPKGDNSLSLLVANVRMENEDKDRFLRLVKSRSPDVLLVNEPDQAWADAIRELDRDFPHSVKHPQDNTFGMMLLSKLPLSETAVNFFVEDHIPSIFARITLPSGTVVDLYGVHPEPPKLGSDTYERDTELLIIGNRIKKSNNPSIVAGDLNDVGWSVTSKLFRKYSKLVDPRIGRGLFNTYNAFVPFGRFPLDHIFYSKEFGLITLRTLEHIGSDHFPLFIHLNYEPEHDTTEDLESTDAEEKAEVADHFDSAQ